MVFSTLAPTRFRGRLQKSEKQGWRRPKKATKKNGPARQALFWSFLEGGKHQTVATWILRDGQESRQTPIRYHSYKELCTQQMQLMFSTALNAALASTFGRYEKDIHRTLTKGVRDRKSTTFLPRLRGDCGSYRCPALFLDDGSGRSRLCCWADKCAEKLKRHFEMVASPSIDFQKWLKAVFLPVHPCCALPGPQCLDCSRCTASDANCAAGSRGDDGPRRGGCPVGALVCTKWSLAGMLTSNDRTVDELLV